MSNLEKKPTLQEWFAILSFAVNQIKSLFNSVEWKRRLARKNEARIEVLEKQVKSLAEGLEAATEINVLQQQEIDELKTIKS